MPFLKIQKFYFNQFCRGVSQEHNKAKNLQRSRILLNKLVAFSRILKAGKIDLFSLNFGLMAF